ncbi:MAG: site-specific integrase [Prevotella sp.]|nr:site-specific integrase [Prevotella sp.]
MRAIRYNLSTKVNEKGYQRLYMVIKDDYVTSRGKTNIFIHKDFFDKKRGIDELGLTRKRTHIAQKATREALLELNDIKDFVTKQIEGEKLSKELLPNILNEYYGIVLDDEIAKELEERASNATPTLEELFEMCIASKRLKPHVAKCYRTLVRTLRRYEGYTKFKSKNPQYMFDLDKVTHQELEDITAYFRDEDTYAKQYPALFKKLLKEHCVSTKSGRNVLRGRGQSTISKMQSYLKSFFNWCRKQHYTNNTPFEDFEIEPQRYADPVGLSIEQRDRLATAQLPTKHLRTQRDIFIFQCWVGCRVSDLITLTEKNIKDINGEKYLQYVPIKTKDVHEQIQNVCVPLLDEALEYIERYRGVDAKGRLMPFISPQRYNDAIKEMFKLAGLDDMVSVRNQKTNNDELKPLYEVASSHMARKTFVTILYNNGVADPKLIGMMSGHSSDAIERYIRRELHTMREAIGNLRKKI